MKCTKCNSEFNKFDNHIVYYKYAVEQTPICPFCKEPISDEEIRKDIKEKFG